MDDKLFAGLESGTVCLTATRRLASALSGDYGAAKAATGSGVWLSPAILALEEWTLKARQAAWVEKSVIPDALALVLWERIISADAGEAGLELMDLPGAATLAQEALELVSLYEIPVGPEFSSTEESRAFARWLARFERELGKRSWTCRPRLAGEVAALIAAGRIRPPERVILAGFDELPPARERLVRAMRQAGADVSFHEETGANVSGSVYRAQTPSDEVKAAALWALDIIEREPGAKIGVAAVSLDRYRRLVERHFREILSPLSILKASDGFEPYDISLGGPLSDEAPAATAISLIEASISRQHNEFWRELLRKPFWEKGGGRIEMASAGRELARRGPPAAGLKEVAGFFARRAGDTPYAGPLAEALLRLSSSADMKGVRPPSEWASAFAKILEAASWARNAGLKSGEYQAAEKFRDLLSAMAAYDNVTSGVEAGWALRRLKIDAAAPFRPKVVSAPVTVVGMLEAGGMTFDHLWLLGASLRSLPPETSANPFVPYALQARCGVRQALPKEAFKRAERLFGRIVGGAADFVASYPALDEGSEERPSPLLMGMEAKEPKFADDTSLAAQAARLGPVGLESLADMGRPLEDGEEPGAGSRLFSLEAQCPFRAYAELRLKIEQEDEPSLGMDARIQGSMLHAALKSLHGAFPDRAAILAATESDREDALEKAVSEALSSREAATLGLRLAANEAAKLRETLHVWLSLEAERPDFEVIEREAVRTLIAGKIPVKLRIDRLDRVDGGEVIIDYKSGAKPLPANRFYDDRLVEPQLPLYALACPEATGIAYASMSREECKLNGIAACGVSRGVKEIGNWEELKIIWRQKIEGLAAEFAEGRVDPDPDGARRHCRYCSLDPLCRVDGEKTGEEE